MTRADRLAPLLTPAGALGSAGGVRTTASSQATSGRCCRLSRSRRPQAVVAASRDRHDGPPTFPRYRLRSADDASLRRMRQASDGSVLPVALRQNRVLRFDPRARVVFEQLSVGHRCSAFSGAADGRSWLELEAVNVSHSCRRPLEGRERPARHSRPVRRLPARDAGANSAACVASMNSRPDRRSKFGPAASHLISPRPSSLRRMRWAATSGASLSVSITTSGLSGSS
jgi:hypothetical protein